MQNAMKADQKPVVGLDIQNLPLSPSCFHSAHSFLVYEVGAKARVEVRIQERG